MHAQLVPLKGSTKPIVIRRDLTVVGREAGTCDVYIERASVSKLHCVIVKTDGLLFIRDLGSTNGTKVNGQRVTRGALLPGDELAFAGLKFRVEMGPDRVHEDAVDDRALTEEISSVPEPELRELFAKAGGKPVALAGSLDDSRSDVRLLDDE